MHSNELATQNQQGKHKTLGKQAHLTAGVPFERIRGNVQRSLDRLLIQIISLIAAESELENVSVQARKKVIALT